MTAYGSTSHVCHMELSRTGRHHADQSIEMVADITSVQSGVMAVIEKMSCVALLNNTTNVNSPTCSSVNGNEYR